MKFPLLEKGNLIRNKIEYEGNYLKWIKDVFVSEKNVEKISFRTQKKQIDEIITFRSSGSGRPSIGSSRLVFGADLHKGVCQPIDVNDQSGDD